MSKKKFVKTIGSRQKVKEFLIKDNGAMRGVSIDFLFEAGWVPYVDPKTQFEDDEPKEVEVKTEPEQPITEETTEPDQTTEEKPARKPRKKRTTKEK